MAKFFTERKIRALFLVTPFFFWLFLCRDFFMLRSDYGFDALSYFIHIKYYLNNIQTGVYPLWDPTWDWGLSNNFILRRFGEFNPFLYLALIGWHLNQPIFITYLICQSLYFFIGLLGFYLVAQRLFSDDRVAYCAYVLLLFSTLGATIFSTYLILLFVPIIWFFYFLLTFSSRPQRHSLLGITFCLMIIMTTYLPFYFLTILFFFLVNFLLFYPQKTCAAISQGFRFAKSHKLLVLFCLGAILLSALPGLSLFADMHASQIIIPGRQHLEGLQSSTNSLEVVINRIEVGGLCWPIILEHLFSDFKNIELTTLYIPFLAFLILAMGSLAHSRRRLFFLIAWGLGIFFLALSDATPVHRILHKYIFFFHYFRNLQYFLWIFLLPIFILITGEILESLLKSPPPNVRQKILRIIGILILHGLAGVFIFFQTDLASPKTVVLLVGSALFFCGYYARLFSDNKIVFQFLVCLLIIPQSSEVYNFLKENSRQDNPRIWLKEEKINPPFNSRVARITFTFTRGAAITPDQILPEHRGNPRFYVGSPWSRWLCENIDLLTFTEYLRHRLRVYNSVEPFTEDNKNISRVVWAFRKKEDVAFIPASEAQTLPPNLLLPPTVYQAQSIEFNSPELSVKSFDANHLTLKTNFRQPRFLVYNDSYDKNWQVSINGRKVPLYRANIAFKGVAVPQGEATVEFRFGRLSTYLLRYFLIGLFFFILALVITTAIRERRRSCAPEN